MHTLSKSPNTPPQICVHLSQTCCQTLKHFDNVISTCCEIIVEVFESLTTSFWKMDIPLCSGHLRGIWRTITFNVILTITNDTSKNLHPNGTKWRPIMTYIHSPVYASVSFHRSTLIRCRYQKTVIYRQSEYSINKQHTIIVQQILKWYDKQIFLLKCLTE